MARVNAMNGYCLHGGFVRSIRDGQEHFVSATKLVDLYVIPSNVTWWPQTGQYDHRPQPGNVCLRPDPTGHYILPPLPNQPAEEEDEPYVRHPIKPCEHPDDALEPPTYAGSPADPDEWICMDCGETRVKRVSKSKVYVGDEEVGYVLGDVSLDLNKNSLDPAEFAAMYQNSLYDQRVIKVDLRGSDLDEMIHRVNVAYSEVMRARRREFYWRASRHTTYDLMKLSGAGTYAMPFVVMRPVPPVEFKIFDVPVKIDEGVSDGFLEAVFRQVNTYPTIRGWP